MHNLPEAVLALGILASPQSPIRDLLAGITRQLTLTQPPPGTAAATQATGGAPAEPPNLIGQAGEPSPVKPDAAIEHRYTALIAFVGKGRDAPIDHALKMLNDLQARLATPVAKPAGGSTAVPGGGDDPVQLLNAKASFDPQPVAGWLHTIATSVGQLISRQQ